MTIRMIFAMLLIIIAEMIRRGVFYGLHMTVRMA